MTSQLPERQDHISDHLPAYANGKLDPLIADQVNEHLSHCNTCQAELSTWTIVASVILNLDEMITKN